MQTMSDRGHIPCKMRRASSQVFWKWCRPTVAEVLQAYVRISAAGQDTAKPFEEVCTACPDAHTTIPCHLSQHVAAICPAWPRGRGLLGHALWRSSLSLLELEVDQKFHILTSSMYRLRWACASILIKLCSSTCYMRRSRSRLIRCFDASHCMGHRIPSLFSVHARALAGNKLCTYAVIINAERLAYI